VSRDTDSRQVAGDRRLAALDRPARRASDPDGAELLAQVLGVPGRHDIGFDEQAWRKLVLEAECRGLCGLALERVESLGIRASTAMEGRLRAGKTNAAAEELNTVHEAQRVLGVLHDAGVPVLLLKGLALLATVYRRPGLRPMGDIDLLIRPEDVERATKALTRIDCRRGAEFVRDDFFPRYYYETEWITRSPRPVRIDLHVRPFRPLRAACTVPDDALWHDATPITVGDSPAWIPEPSRLLIHLCAHAAFHGCERLIWLHDIHRFMRQLAEQLDWDRFLSLTKSWRLVLPVRTAIRACVHTLGTDVPRDVGQALAGGRVSWRDRLVLWQSPHDAERPVLHVLTNAVTTPRLRVATGYLAACVGPNRAHLEEVYPWRHPGWMAAASCWRVLRALARPVAGLVPSGVQSAPPEAQVRH